ncbi:MAG: hypothetical protein KGJ59_05310 [Bacteroidota bacterium]|nr:hypothetical protein [Bacteroidota bacterium]
MKKVLIGFVAVFLTLEILDAIIHGGILMSTYESMQNVWRTDMMQKMWILHFVKLVTAFFFALIFSKGYENKGIMEGIRYGFYVGMIVASGFAFGSYASYPIRYQLALAWFFLSLAEYIIAGIVLAYAFGMKKQAAPQA